MPRYRYMHEGQPLTHCPQCSSLLTNNNGDIDIDLSTAGSVVWTVQSYLENGWLVDPTGAIMSGFHNCTRCGHCGEMLINMDIEEEQHEDSH